MTKLTNTKTKPCKIVLLIQNVALSLLQ